MYYILEMDLHLNNTGQDKRMRNPYCTQTIVQSPMFCALPDGNVPLKEISQQFPLMA